MHQVKLWFLSVAACDGLFLHVAEHVCLKDAWLCILSSPPSPGHRAFVVYVPIGGVQHELQTSRVMLLVLHCIYIPGPVGCYVASRSNHGCTK